MLNARALFMGSRRVRPGVTFGLGAAVGLSTAVLVNVIEDRWRRQRDLDELPRPNDQLRGAAAADINSKCFK